MACAWLLCSAACARADGEKIVYKLHFTQGQTFGLKLSNSNRLTQTVGSQQCDIKAFTGLTMLLGVTSVDLAGTALMNATYQSVNYSLDSPTEHGKCDTANPNAICDPLAAGMAALAGQGFTMRVSSDGRVFDVEGVEKIMKRAEDMLATAPEEVKLSAMAAVRQNCGPKATQEEMEDIFNFLPSHPVAVGERWSMSHVTTAGIPAQFTSYYKVTARNN